ncbi:hypothetical protein [Nitrobacter winogradskyi]|uniref:Uncharacterized protein n=1 Tax=Nitrobacter winogradskyi TaxID=913 RepID=A0ACC6APX9_NITWI|nr:hypothetical protein [Nitrobacter winogradskyi]MCP2001326.1 hypothetical protein [Nitrobacter winogradskyi]
MDAGRLTQKNKKNIDVTSSDPMPNVVVLVLGAATCRAVWRGRRIQRTGTRRRSNEGRDDQTNPTLANNNAASKYIVVPTIIPEDKKADRVDDHDVVSEDAVTHVRPHDQPVDVHQVGQERRGTSRNTFAMIRPPERSLSSSNISRTYLTASGF